MYFDSINEIGIDVMGSNGIETNQLSFNLLLM